MKVLERIGEQANMRKKVEGYGLKFMHSNWNSNSSNNICYEFEVIFWVLIEVIFGYTIYHFKSWEVRNPTFQTVSNQSWNKEDMDDWRELCKEESKECQFCMNISHDHVKWTKEIVFAKAWKSILHEHVNFCTTMSNVPKWC